MREAERGCELSLSPSWSPNGLGQLNESEIKDRPFRGGIQGLKAGHGVHCMLMKPAEWLYGPQTSLRLIMASLLPDKSPKLGAPGLLREVKNGARFLAGRGFNLWKHEPFKYRQHGPETWSSGRGSTFNYEEVTSWGVCRGYGEQKWVDACFSLPSTSSFSPVARDDHSLLVSCQQFDINSLSY